MKTLLTALVATVISSASFAHQPHSVDCPKDCAKKSTLLAPLAKNYDRKVAELNNTAENKAGWLNYNRTMQVTLNNLDKEKHVNAIENLESAEAYNRLMANMLDVVDQQNLADQMEDLSASQRFEELMGSIFGTTALR